MKTLTIRNVPDDLYKTISRIAQQNRRSIQQQVLVILDKARVYDNETPIDKAMAIRQALMGRDLGNTLEEIHAERNQ
ncbi:MAG: hypothetical protein JW932_16775 [Deltaproteobacteria bacterium]|nr:hypothetical protein [Deltaproteobacteria bacterium]